VQRFVNDSTSLYQQGGPQMSPDSRVAPFNQSELAAQTTLQNAAGDAGNLANSAGAAAHFNLGAGRDPNSNPFLQSAIRSATQPVIDNLLEQALPRIRNQSFLSGTYGGSRQGIAEGNAVRDTARVATDTASQMANQGYLSGQANATNTMQLLPTLQQGFAAPATMQGAVGEQERALQEAVLNENANRYEYNQQLPYQNLTQYGNAVRQPFGTEGGTTTTVPPPSTASQIAGGALSIPALIAILKQLKIT
jgi:hypothetical protein